MSYYGVDDRAMQRSVRRGRVHEVRAIGAIDKVGRRPVLCG
ncbi:MAG: hypothetical protein WD066_12935 [Planctomycetaceae bacterium]